MTRRILVTFTLLAVLFCGSLHLAAQTPFTPEVNISGSLGVLSEINFRSAGGFNVLRSTAPPFTWGGGGGTVEEDGNGEGSGCVYRQLIKADASALAAYGDLSVSGIASLINQGYSVCPTVESPGVRSAAPGSARSSAEPTFADHVTFTSDSLLPGTMTSVRLLLNFHSSGRSGFTETIDETSVTGTASTNFFDPQGVRRTAVFVIFRTNGSFASQITVEASNPQSVFTAQIQVGAKLGCAVQLAGETSARNREGGDIVSQVSQYSGRVTLYIEPLDPSVRVTSASGTSYSSRKGQELLMNRITNNQIALRIPPGMKLQSAQPGTNGWKWSDRENRDLIFIPATNQIEFFRAVMP